MDEETIVDGLARLAGAQYRHAARALRLRVGEQVGLFTALGQEWQGVVESIEPGELRVRIVEVLAPEPPPVFALTLGQAVGKGEKMDLVVQKGSELGVTALTPVITARTAVRLDESAQNARLARWRRIAVAAAEQSGRRRPLVLNPFMTTERLAGEISRYDACLLAWEGGGGQCLREAIGGLRQPATLLALVGPEGGWEPAEVETLERAGAIAVGLGRRILRTETAAMALAAILMYELGDLGRG